MRILCVREADDGSDWEGKKSMTGKINIEESLHNQIIRSSLPVVQTKHSQIGRIRQVNKIS